PAYIKTDFLSTNLGFSSETIASTEEIRRRNYPLRRIGDVADVANTITFLVSDDASFISGDCLVVDGGARYTNMRL
ncbi:hypothetical protein B4U80_06410, partial [Leptotrombidium deliense]